MYAMLVRGDELEWFYIIHHIVSIVSFRACTVSEICQVK